MLRRVCDFFFGTTVEVVVVVEVDALASVARRWENTSQSRVDEYEIRAVRTLRVARTSPRLAEVVAWRATGSPRSIEFAGERVGPTASDGLPAVSADTR